MTLPKYCFDTHALVWYFKGVKTLSNKAKQILDQTFEGNAIAFIPSIVILEAFHISLKDKEFIFSKFIKYLARTKFIVIPMNEETLKIGFGLSEKINIHDRSVVSTAIYTKSTLVTKDGILRNLFPTETIW